MLPSTIHIMWNFEVAMSNGLGEDAFTRKYIIWPGPQCQGHMKCCLVPSTSCDLCTCKIWSCYFQKFMGRWVYKKIHYLTFDLDLGVKFTWKGTQYPPSTSCDLCIYKVWSCYVQRFRRRYNHKKRDRRMDRHTDDRLTLVQINIPYFSNAKAGIINFHVCT